MDKNPFLSQAPQEDANPFISQDTPQGGWGDFLKTADQISQQRNYPANVLEAQAALESGRGTSNFAKNRNNYFGMQAYDSNPDAATKYGSPVQSINDYIDLIENTPRYKAAYQQYLQDHDPKRLIQGIRAAGYATDPNYVSKIESMPEFQTLPTIQ